MKIATIVGARPQFIKAGTLSREFALHENIEEILIHTGQHYDSNMSNIFFEEMAITPPKYFLGIGGSSHGSMTGQMIEKIEEVLITESPNYVLLYGDTNSTLAGAIAASKLDIKIIHVEAGLRSFNNLMPEEINRILTDRISSLLFCPTKTSYQNLIDEGLKHWDAKAFVVGDVMQDGAFFYKDFSKNIEDNRLPKNNFILCTIHRADNTNDISKLKSIFDALNVMSENTKIVLPLHPRTKNKLKNYSINISDNILLIEPVGYLNMIWLIEKCSLVATDSGGLQKEAFFFSKPCITLRSETEWVELVNAGVNTLTGSDKDLILKAYLKYKNNKIPIFDQSLYGGGQAAQNIVNQIIINYNENEFS
jgi:UDP-GlcNAc3NAcA epimerase